MATPPTAAAGRAGARGDAEAAEAAPFVITYEDGQLELSAAEFQFFSQLFTILDSDGDEAVSGEESAAFLRRTRLADEVLREIWRLACGGVSKLKLDRNEWILACKFVSLVQQGASHHAQGEAAPKLSREFLFQNSIKLGLPEFGIFPRAPDYTTNVAPALAASTCKVQVTNPKVVGTGMQKHVLYTVELDTTLPHFQRKHTAVKRRYSDFRWLHRRLCEAFPGTAIPPLPETRMFGNMSSAFVEARRLALEEYLDEVARHPKLTQSFAVQAMLEASSEGFDVYRLMMDAARRSRGGPASGPGAAGAGSGPPRGPPSLTPSPPLADTDLAWDDDLDLIDSASAASSASANVCAASANASATQTDLSSAATARAADVAGAAAAAASSWISSFVKKVEQSSIISGLEEATGAASSANSASQMDTHVRHEMVRLGVRPDTITAFRAELADYGRRLHAAVKVVDKLVSSRRAGGYELARIGAYFGSLAKVEASCANPLGTAPTPDQDFFEDLAARFDQSSNHVQDLNDRAASGLLAPLRKQAAKIGAIGAVIDNHDARVLALRQAHEALEAAKKRYASARARSAGVDAAHAAVRTAERDILDAEQTLVQLHDSVNLEMQKFTAERARDVNIILKAFANAEIQGALETQQMLLPLQQLCSDNFDGAVENSIDRIHQNYSRTSSTMSTSELPSWFLQKASLAPPP